METPLSHTTAVYKPTRADYTRYNTTLVQIHKDLDRVNKAMFRIGRNLNNIREHNLYLCGGYPTFEAFCRAELGKSRIHAFRLIQAYDLMCHLLEQGIAEEDLPPNERLCREIRALDTESQAAVWKLVLKHSRAKDSAPSRSEVQDAAV